MHDLLASSRDLALEVFISRNLVGFLKEALERVGRVYQVRVRVRVRVRGRGRGRGRGRVRVGRVYQVRGP